jgi:hypothetical protein
MSSNRGSTGASSRFVWQEIIWPRPFEIEQAVALLRSIAADQRSAQIVFEARAANGAVRYLVGAEPTALRRLSRLLTGLLPGVQLLNAPARTPVTTALRLKLSTRHRALDSSRVDAVTVATLAALIHAGKDEVLVLQLILGPRRIPLAVPMHSPSSVVAPWWQIVWHGNGGLLDGEKRSALRAKVAEHGFAATVRLGVKASSPTRRRMLLIDMVGALRTSEAPGVQLRARRDSATKLNDARPPWLWPLRIGVSESLLLTGWPVGDRELPGQPAKHPVLLPPTAGAFALASAAPAMDRRVMGRATAPGFDGWLALGARDSLQHLHVLGPTGTGKSTLLARLITQDIEQGRGVVVIDPKGDLVTDVLARMPKTRLDDVVVLDPTDNRPVGLNPLARSAGTPPAVVVDGVLAVFHQLYADSWGPRLQDILHACLLTLARRDDASLVMLPLLLTNTGFRRSLTQHLNDPVALGPFWAWYEALSEAERAAVVAPVMNKLRAFLLRPQVRAVLGQRQPKFQVSQVFTERKILLVNLSKGLVGPEAAGLLGSLVVADIWRSTLARAGVPANQRHPVSIYIDELQDYLHLPTDLADALAQARGLGVGFTLAHQHLGQLPTAMRTAVLSNARSRVVFQLGHEDATTMAKGHAELTADDFTALGAHEIYASLMAANKVTPYASAITLPLGKTTSSPRELRDRSRDRYGRPLDEIEASFTELLVGHDPAPSTNRRPKATS